MHANAVRRLALAALVLSGCSSYPPMSAQVVGTVTMDGKPASMTAVFFIPEDREMHAAGMIGQGFTDDSGAFALKNFRGEDSFFRGRFKVTFTRYIDRRGRPIPLEVKPDDVGAEQQLPPEYINPETTPYTVEVSESNRTFAFDLKTSRAK